MPSTVIRVFGSTPDDIPLIAWLDELEQTKPRAYIKCLERILHLEKLGSELRRPLADTLRDGVRELRVKVGTMNYRILYFFCGSNLVCLSHGITKKDKVPKLEIDLAIQRKELVESDLDRYTVSWEI